MWVRVDETTGPYFSQKERKKEKIQTNKTTTPSVYTISPRVRTESLLLSGGAATFLLTFQSPSGIFFILKHVPPQR